MKVLILGCILAIFAIANCYQRCSPDFSWAPFNGKVPDGAFVGGLDADGNPTYIAKFVVTDDASLWTTPAQLYQGKDYIDFAWHESKNVMRINQFIEVLVPDEKNTLKWVDVKNSADLEHNLQEVGEKCCMVEGGIGVQDNHVYLAYIGKVVPDGKTSYIGRLYKDSWIGVHIMYGTNATKGFDDIKVLTYGCDDFNVVDLDERQTT